MDPLYKNIIVAAASIAYVFAVVSIMDLFVKKGLPQDISRKIVHIAAGSWLIFWLFLDMGHWSKYFNIAPAFIWTVLLTIKGLTASPDDEAVRTMTRTGSRKELLKGPLYFTLVMILMGTLYLNTGLALTTMGILGWGDGLAPVFGKRFGKRKYIIFAEKSLEGSLAFLFFGIIGAILFNYIFHDSINFARIATCGIAAMLVEASSPKDLDNIFIPAVCIIFYQFVF